MKEKISVTIESGVIRTVESLVDGIRIKNRSDAIEHLLMKSVSDKRVAVVMCGGDEDKQRLHDGSFRFLAKINGVTVIEDTLLQLKSFGFSNVFIVGRNSVLTSIFSILKNGASLGLFLEYVEEIESRGTAETLRLLSSKINSDFLVVYGDIVFRFDLRRLFREHIMNGGLVTLVLSSAARPAEKGTVQLDGNKVLSFSQKVKNPESFIAFSSIFVASAGIFSMDGDSLEEDVFSKLALEGRLYGLVLSGKEVHIHRKSDLKKVRDVIRSS